MLGLRLRFVIVRFVQLRFDKETCHYFLTDLYIPGESKKSFGVWRAVE